MTLAVFMLSIDLSCHLKVVSWLRKNFSDPQKAAAFYFPAVGDNSTQTSLIVEEASTQTSLIVKEASTQTSLIVKEASTQISLHVDASTQTEECLSADVPEDFLELPEDFLELTKSAMHHLRKEGRTNVVYNFVKAVGTMRTDGTDSLLPVKRMPMGLMEYAVNFFVSEEMNRVCPIYRLCYISKLYFKFSCTCTCSVHNYFLCRSHLAQLTTKSGVKPCTHSLVRSGSIFMVDHCGALGNCKVPLLNEREELRQ